MAESGRGTFGDSSLEKWEVLGSGSFGVVLKATDKVWGRGVAIKIINSDDSPSTVYNALCREADYMEAANQQFVPRVFGMYRGNPPILSGRREWQGIVMELMEGGSLSSFLIHQTQCRPPPWPLAFRLAHQVAQAMDFLHSKKNLVHMDLKPANILLDADFNAKIADFGLSTVSNSVMTTNRENQGGTRNYTPPEAFEVGYRRKRSYDVYSYGILLWTILTGETPFAGVDHSLLAFHVPRGARPDVGKIDVQKAAGLEELVELMQKCWNSDPEARPLFAECVEVTGGVLSRHEEGLSAACDLLRPPPLSAPPPPAPGLTNRDAFLQYSRPLSLDPNTVSRRLILSEDNRRVSWASADQPYADHPERFSYWENVLSRECFVDAAVAGPSYVEVEWNGEHVEVALCQRDMDRKDRDLSDFGRTPQSWMLRYYESDKRYVFRHNLVETTVPGPAVLPAGQSNRWGVYADPATGLLCFYHVRGDAMSLLHVERATITRPLYAGIQVYKAAAEVCEIW